MFTLESSKAVHVALRGWPKCRCTLSFNPTFPKDPKVKKALAFLAVAAVSNLALAAEFACTVHCKTNGGDIERIQVSVNASDSSQAAKIIDPQGHQLCRQAGYPRATDSTMSSSQCSRK